jgi:enoyl-CoA hydratase/carnithine racemase
MSAMSGWEQGDESNSLLTELVGGVALVKFNRPARLNAWTPALGVKYFSKLEELSRDDNVRAIVVTGEGRAFCSGADVSGVAGLAEAGKFTRTTPQAQRRPYWYPMSLGKPLIAAVNGACVGIGLQQALCCDLRFVADDAKISTAYAKRGLPGECGMTWLLPRLVGTANAMDLLLSARVVRGDEAQRMGLANRVLPAAQLLDETMAYAQGLAKSCSPWSMRTLKQQLYADLMSGMPSATARADRLLEPAMAGRDFAEGVKSWVEKRDPDFPPLAHDLAFIDLPDPEQQVKGGA